MLYVRGIFPEAGSPVWGVIQERIQGANLGNAGGGLWNIATDRIRSTDTPGSSNER